VTEPVQDLAGGASVAVCGVEPESVDDTVAALRTVETTSRDLLAVNPASPGD
jgi:hypothetical protein